MRFLDLLRMSSSNLLRRKLRTLLTVLGVVIGTASIVVMISLGLGLQKQSLEQIEEYGGLTTIQVYQNYNVNGDGSEEEKRLGDELVEQISKMEHVDMVTPILSFGILAKKGSYEAYLQVNGMTAEALQNMNVEVGTGSLPTEGEGLEFFYGNQVICDFYNSRTYEDYWSTGEAPDIDLMNDTIFYIFDKDAYWESQNSGNGQAVTPPKKYIVPTSGIMAGDLNYYGNGSWNVYAEINALKAQLKKIFKNKVIPGQPSTKSGKPYKEFYYEELQVQVDDIDAVQGVQEKIRALGYSADSNAEWMEQTQEQMRTIQLVLGGIGAVSLFVAAIGITNTMMMSIYERTKEIGVIKVLGCDMRNIRTMFLMEAGFIGFFGGLVGLALSYGISMLINWISGQSLEGVSYIPVWLALVALVFAVFVGMLSGFLPALRAMKLSPLSAIRNE